MSSENKRSATNDVQRVEPDIIERRSLVTEVVVPLVPPAVVAAGIAVDYLQNRPPKPEPPKIVLPPGVEKE
jgi:hypothetical protein